MSIIKAKGIQMFKSIEELKSFIEWAKARKLKTVSIDSVKFEFSDLALVDLGNLEPSTEKEMSRFSSGTLVDTEKFNEQEEEDLLYYSSPLKPMK